MKCIAWTKEEDQVILAKFPQGGVDALVPLLRNRSRASIKQRAHILHVTTKMLPKNRRKAQLDTSVAEIGELNRQLRLIDQRIAEFEAERCRIVRKISDIRYKNAGNHHFHLRCA